MMHNFFLRIRVHFQPMSRIMHNHTTVFYVELFGDRTGTLPFLNRWTVNTTPQTVNVNLSSCHQRFDVLDYTVHLTYHVKA